MPITPIVDLIRLLAEMKPLRDPEPYVFALHPGGPAPAGISAIMRFMEVEGETLICSETTAKAAGLTHSPPYVRITLSVHSALEAVGFLAAACSALAAAGISTNAVAAYHHDHIFVPANRADDAMNALNTLSADARLPKE